MKKNYRMRKLDFDLIEEIKSNMTITRSARNKDKIFVGVTVWNDSKDNPVLITDYKYQWSDDYDSVEIIVSKYDLDNRPNRVWRKLENAIINIYGNMSWSDRRKQIRRRKMRAAEMAKKNPPRRPRLTNRRSADNNC